MANFPLSVYSPSAVSNGQTIDASRDNNQDAEITAIESGILQGTAPLNSSNSTVAALSVTGGSTLGGTLSVIGGSTFTVRPVMPPPEMALVFRDSTGAMGSSAASTVVWNADAFLGNSSAHSTGTNPERLTPQTTGVFRFVSQVAFSNPSTTVPITLDLKDSSGTIIGTTKQLCSTGTVGLNAVTMQVMGYKRFDALGGYVITAITASHTSTLSLSSGVGVTWGLMQKL